MGKVQIELSESRAISILGTLDNDLDEAEQLVENAREDENEFLARRLEFDRNESEQDFKAFGEQVIEQIEGELSGDLAFLNKDKLE